MKLYIIKNHKTTFSWIIFAHHKDFIFKHIYTLHKQFNNFPIYFNRVLPLPEKVNGLKRFEFELVVLTRARDYIK